MCIRDRLCTIFSAGPDPFFLSCKQAFSKSSQHGRACNFLNLYSFVISVNNWSRLRDGLKQLHLVKVSETKANSPRLKSWSLWVVLLPFELKNNCIVTVIWRTFLRRSVKLADQEVITYHTASASRLDCPFVQRLLRKSPTCSQKYHTLSSADRSPFILGNSVSLTQRKPSLFKLDSYYWILNTFNVIRMQYQLLKIFAKGNDVLYETQKLHFQS